MRKSLLVILLLVLGGAATASAATRSNLVLFTEVSDTINSYAYFTIFDSVSAQVDDGQVTLSGKVTLPFKASEIEKRVRQIDGVNDVRNEITVLPASSFDDTLRLEIARAVYSHPALSMYALGPNPSIHIVVERGRVTLEGVVNNDMDRTIAGSIARSFQAFDVKNNLKTNEEVDKQFERL